MSDTPHDPIPALRAEVDQSIALAPEFARLMRGLFDAYRGEGFSEEQAPRLAMDQMRRQTSNE